MKYLVGAPPKEGHDSPNDLDVLIRLVATPPKVGETMKYLVATPPKEGHDSPNDLDTSIRLGDASPIDSDASTRLGEVIKSLVDAPP